MVSSNAGGAFTGPTLVYDGAAPTLGVDLAVGPTFKAVAFVVEGAAPGVYVSTDVGAGWRAARLAGGGDGARYPALGWTYQNTWYGLVYWQSGTQQVTYTESSNGGESHTTFTLAGTAKGVAGMSYSAAGLYDAVTWSTAGPADILAGELAREAYVARRPRTVADWNCPTCWARVVVNPDIGSRLSTQVARSAVMSTVDGVYLLYGMMSDVAGGPEHLLLAYCDRDCAGPDGWRTGYVAYDWGWETGISAVGLAVNTAQSTIHAVYTSSRTSPPVSHQTLVVPGAVWRRVR